jgi:hypothetical protein
MATLLVIVGLVLAGAALFAVAWVLSGARFQGRSRGRRPDRSSRAEQEAQAQANSFNLGGSGTIP